MGWPTVPTTARTTTLVRLCTLALYLVSITAFATYPSITRRGARAQPDLSTLVQERRYLSSTTTTTTTTEDNNESSSSSSWPPLQLLTGNVTVLEQSENYVVVSKPHAVVCHHSEWTGGSRRVSNSDREIPMLQRVRQAVGQRVNLVHRLDRGCTGCLLMTFQDQPNATSTLIASMAGQKNKTYLALVRGEGVLGEQNFVNQGWFRVDRRIKNENGVEQDAVTWFRFIAGQGNDRGQLDRPRASLVLARPETGRWHQIRRHLRGLSHPILGDATHGILKENRYWKKRGMLPERTCLHLLSLQLEPTCVSPNGIDVTCPLAPDMLQMLQDHLPDVLERALPILRDEEGIDLLNNPAYDEAKIVTLPYEIEI